MVMEDRTPSRSYERQLLGIVRRLPPERGQQLLAFGRFLAYETFETTELDFLEEEFRRHLHRRMSVGMCFLLLTKDNWH